MINNIPATHPAAIRAVSVWSALTPEEQQNRIYQSFMLTFLGVYCCCSRLVCAFPKFDDFSSMKPEALLQFRDRNDQIAFMPVTRWLYRNEDLMVGLKRSTDSAFRTDFIGTGASFQKINNSGNYLRE